MHRVWGKPDANQAAIVAALRKAGYRVQPLSAVGGGCPDLLVSRNNHTWVVEVKEPGGTLTPAQKKWIGSWDAPVYVVNTIEGALNHLKERP